MYIEINSTKVKIQQEEIILTLSMNKNNLFGYISKEVDLTKTIYSLLNRN